jgi:thymidylate kinase
LKIISIIGPDGVGKTTQARMLIEELKKRNYKTRYLWMRWNHKFSLPILVLARLLRLSEVKKLKYGKKIVYHYFNRNKAIELIYKYTTFIDTIISVFFKVYFISSFNDFLICDRYIYDIIIDLAISTRNPKLLDSFISRLFLSLSKEVTAITLMVNYDTLKHRKYDVLKDKDLKLKIHLYKIFSKYLKIPLIDAEKPINEVHLDIMKIIGR